MLRDRLSLWWFRFRDLPWLKISLGAVATFAVIATVPPLREATAAFAGRVVLTVMSPFAPSISGFQDLPQASKVLAADGTEVGRLGGEERHPVELSRLPAHVVQSVLAAEDANFAEHGGVDLTALARAAWNDVRGRKLQGGSTITQQLAKLNYTGSERTIFRKLREVLYASKLEQKYSKRELLERYLNQVYFGEGNYGIAAASDHYFGTTPERLTMAQAATLAGMIHAPGALDPYRRADAVVERRNHVLSEMAEHGWADDNVRRTASAEPLTVVPEKPAPTGPGRAPHFVQFVGREATRLDELGGTEASRAKQAFAGGYTFETTLDLKALDAATKSVQQTLGQPGDPTAAIASVQPGDGAVRVLFGGLDPNRRFDVASQGRRQPGSSYKPYLYLAALEAGIDPRSVLDSGSPKTVNCGGEPWRVKNYEGEGRGPITVDDGLTHSVNTVFQQLMAEVGPRAMQRMATRLGLPHEAVSPARCAIALGGVAQGVTPLEQAAAFATFAAKGLYAQPYSIVRIKNRHGEVVYERTPKTTPAIPDKEAGVVNAALSRVVDGGTGSAAAIGRPLAGKTGTTENYADAWFIGYVPQLSTAVWVGHPDGLVPMTDVHGIAVSGGSFPARIFGRYMSTAVAGMPKQSLYTASPDELSLHLLNAPPPAPPTTPPSSTTSSSSTSLPPPAPPVGGPSDTQPPRNVQPAPQPSPQPQPRQTTTTRPPVTSTTLKQKATSETTLVP